MKVKLTFLWLVLVVVSANAQTGRTSKLIGTIFDSLGESVEGAKVTAVGFDGKKYETVSEKDGQYTLMLPISKLRRDPRRDLENKFDITVVKPNFYTARIKGYMFYPSQLNIMHLDIGLEVGSIVD